MKTFWTLLVLLVLVGIGMAAWSTVKNGSLEPIKEVEITTFEECVEAGNPILESYPEQCRTPDGKSFTRFIGNELEKIDLIRISSPRPGDRIESPLVIEGEARGYWFFEASFPVVLTNWDGLIIAQHYAEAQLDPNDPESTWMTEDFVPFKSELSFENPVFEGVDENHFSRRGYLILQKDNPSGLPEHDDALEIPVFFE